ncbi:glycosyltransferase family 4 protein [Williamsia sp.]|uniref:glycosyltransferase family 4 protein n=1 Tax=Williamsia sp. TaxID=1872085 RepID=UPI001A2F3CB5|nr:glycosyltransferase family 4 protein [Williamsia sp.]MBJ7288650.1 glycosyltransferase family 4 protein [Williamsia sp.]
MTSANTPVDRILFVAHSGQVSGAEKVMLDLVHRAVYGGVAVTVACAAGPLVDRLPAGVTHIEIDHLGLTGESGLARLAGGARLVARWRAVGRRLRPQVRVPGTATVVNSLYALPAMRWASGPSGVSWLVHDTAVSGRQRAVIRAAKSRIRRAVAVSSATAAPLRAMGVPVTVAQNGVRWPVDALPADLHTPPVVGMLALLTPWKGHRVVLEAAALLPEIEVEFAGGSFPGDVDHVGELHARVSAADLSGRVRFLGHTELHTALTRWDVVVSASVEPEAGPLSVLEAMAYGKPVIGTDHGGTTEFLADGAGVLVPPGDAEALAAAIQQVLSDDGFRATMVAAARRRVADEHDLTRTLPAMLDALLA